MQTIKAEILKIAPVGCTGACNTDDCMMKIKVLAANSNDPGHKFEFIAEVPGKLIVDEELTGDVIQRIADQALGILKAASFMQVLRDIFCLKYRCN